MSTRVVELPHELPKSYSIVTMHAAFRNYGRPLINYYSSHYGSSLLHIHSNMKANIKIPNNFSCYSIRTSAVAQKKNAVRT